MTPFAGVGVNVAMEDALHLARNIIASKPSWPTETERRSSLAAALAKYEAEMFVRAEDYAKQTWMYLGLFFHERGGIAMVEHFERMRAQEAAAADTVATTVAVAVAVEAKEATASETETEAETITKIDTETEPEIEPKMFTEEKKKKTELSQPISVSVSVEEIPVPQTEKLKPEV